MPKKESAFSAKTVSAILPATQQQLLINNPHMMDRRHFIKLTSITGGGLVLGFSMSQSEQSHAQDSGLTLVTDYLQIRPDGRIIIMATQPEVGQGVKTAFPMLVAEELDADWADVEIQQSEIDADRYGSQAAAGSRGTPTVWIPLRRAGAAARAMLLSAAAIRLEVDASELRTENSRVYHDASDRSLTYADLSELAATMPIPDSSSLTLKERDEWRVIGRSIPGVDNTRIVTGSPLFGFDQLQPDMLYANFVKGPRIGAKAELANLDFIKTLPGVVDAFIMEGRGLPNDYTRREPAIHSGVVVVASSTWSAIKAARQLEVRWDNSTAASDTWTDHVEAAKTLAEESGPETLNEKGDVDSAFDSANTTAEGFYTFLAHANLEPQNCTARVTGDSIELWAPTQTPQRALTELAAFFDIPESNIILHQIRIGGGFGRRLANDYVIEAAAIAARYDVPIKAFWTREDDMTFDFYRPGGFHSFKAALDDEGKLTAWQDHFITFARPGSTEPLRTANLPPDEFPVSVLTNARLTQTTLDSGMPAGPMRAPRSNAIAFAVESFLHECSVAAKRDHLEFLLGVLGEPRWLDPGNTGSLNTERAADVLSLAAEKAGWGRQMPEGHGLGLAFHFSHAGHFAHVAEVSVDAGNRVKIHKITVAGDIGPIINPSSAHNQVEGCVIDAISALGLEITFRNGRVDQENFHQYPLGRIGITPEIDIHWVESDYNPTGLGEPAYPPVIPAVTNAIFAATGRRVRTLPLSREGFTI
jgi:isoquinoline 1-oxidoreductase beta subunit